MRGGTLFPYYNYYQGSPFVDSKVRNDQPNNVPHNGWWTHHGSAGRTRELSLPDNVLWTLTLFYMLPLGRWHCRSASILGVPWGKISMYSQIWIVVKAMNNRGYLTNIIDDSVSVSTNTATITTAAPAPMKCALIVLHLMKITHARMASWRFRRRSRRRRKGKKGKRERRRRLSYKLVVIWECE